MTYPDWREPVLNLRRQIRAAANHQLELARQVGLSLDALLPFGVAAALLEVHLHQAIWGTAHPRDNPPTERQLAFLRSLAPEQQVTATANREEVSAWIDHHLMARTAAALERLRLSHGDDVVKTMQYNDRASGERHRWDRLLTVSSIGAKGLVYFKGGNGKCAWPSSLTLPETLQKNDHPLWLKTLARIWREPSGHSRT